jgi:hypothetical protein
MVMDKMMRIMKRRVVDRNTPVPKDAAFMIEERLFPRARLFAINSAAKPKMFLGLTIPIANELMKLLKKIFCEVTP